MKRRVCHMSPGLLMFVMAVIPHTDPLGPAFYCVAGVLMAALTAGILRQYHAIRRHDEPSMLTSVFGYAWSAVLPLMLFPSHAEIGMLVLAILAFGDGSATLCGLQFGGEKLPWNPRKSWMGTISFVAIGGMMATVAYSLEARPVVSLPVALMIGLAVAVVAALAESLPSRINDNIRVGIAANVMAVAMQAFFVGL